MIDDPSYRSFLLRLWHEAGATEPTWRGEIEDIQSGAIVAISSLDEAFTLIRRRAHEDDSTPGSQSREIGNPLGAA
jgi:hypothetical protein